MSINEHHELQSSPLGDSLTPAQRWVLGVGALLVHQQGGDTHAFGGGEPVCDAVWARERLKKNDLDDADDVCRALDRWMRRVPDPLSISLGRDEDGDLWLAFEQGACFPPDDASTTWFALNRLTWDLLRAGNVAGLAYVACMISGAQAWQVAVTVARFVQQSFASWDELAAAAKASARMPDPDIAAARTALQSEGGAWALSWNVDLRHVPRPKERRTTWPVSATAEPGTYTFEDALARASRGDCLELSPGAYVGPWHLQKDIEIVGAGPNVTCQAPSDSPASVMASAGFVRLSRVQFAAPGGGARGQVAVACLAGTVVIEQCRIGSEGHGVSVASAAVAIFFQSRVDSCALNGVVSHGSLDMRHCTLSECSYHTVIVTEQSQARFAHCVFKKGRTHLLGIDDESTARVVDCVFEDSAQAALVVTNQSSLEVMRSTIVRGGIVALNARLCDFFDCRFLEPPMHEPARQQIAVFSGGDEVVLAQCQFEGATYHAVHLDNLRSARVSGSRLNGGAGAGLVASNALEWDEIVVEHTRIETLSGNSALLLDCAKAAFERCAFSGATSSTLVATRQSQLTLNNSTIDDAEARGLHISDRACAVVRNLQIQCVEPTHRVFTIDVDSASVLSLASTDFSRHARTDMKLGENTTFMVFDCPTFDASKVSIERASTAILHINQSVTPTS